MIATAETLKNEQLCSFAQAGDAQAREQLIESNLPFVRQNANKLYADPYRREQLTSCGIDIDDLVQAGSIGLWQTIDSYDPTSGNKFLTYAAPAIKRAMLDLIEQYSRDTIWKLKMDRSQPQQIVYMDKLLEDGDGEGSIGDLVISPYAKQPEQICIERETVAELHEAMAALSNREGMYLRYRFGFEDDAHSMAETAAHFHLSVSRSKGMEQSVLRSVRHELLVAVPERAIAKAEDRSTRILVAEGELHSVELRLKSQNKRGKKVTAAVYEYLADCGGKWGELSYDFRDDSADVLLLAEWDTMVSYRFAMQAIEYLRERRNDGLPDRIVLTFIEPRYK